MLQALANLTAKEVQDMVIAYEPVWALSSGTDFLHHEMPKPDEIQKAVKVIRHNIKELYGVKAAESVRILYVCSANASTAYDLLGVEGIDGLLVGGASLNYHEFSGIVDAAFVNSMQRTSSGRRIKTSSIRCCQTGNNACRCYEQTCYRST